MDSLVPKYLMENLDGVFDSLKCAAKLNVAFSFVPTIVEDWSCRFCYAHEVITVLERSKLVTTTEDLQKSET